MSWEFHIDGAKSQEMAAVSTRIWRTCPADVASLVAKRCQREDGNSREDMDCPPMSPETILGPNLLKAADGSY